jgi:hypothetical protein
VLYKVVADPLETSLATLDADPTAKGVPQYVQDEFYASRQCGVLAHGFARLGGDTCPHQMLLACSCQQRGFWPSCAGRRRAPMAAPLVEQVRPWVPTRPWVVSVPLPLRAWMAPSQTLTATVHTILRRTIHPFSINRAVTHGIDRKTAQAGAVTLLHRFGSAITAHLPLPVLFLAGVSGARADKRLTPRCVTVAPPTDADLAALIHTSSQRVLRPWRQLGDLEAGLAATVATGDAPLRDAPALARTWAAAGQPRLACGERAGQQGRRLGAGLGSCGERPTLPGSRWASGQGFSLPANTPLPAHRRDQWERRSRSTARGAVARERLAPEAHGALLYPCPPRGRLAPPGAHAHPESCWRSSRRGSSTPTPRQPGVAEPDARAPAPHWRWARLRKRVVAMAMARGPVCPHGTLRVKAALTQGSGIKQSLRHLQRAVAPPMAPARPAACAGPAVGPARSAGRPRRCWSRTRWPPSPSVCTPSSVWRRPPTALQPATPWSPRACSALAPQSHRWQ